MSGFPNINPFRLHKDVRVKDQSELARAVENAEKGRLGHRDVSSMTPEQILGEFRHTPGSALRQVGSDALIGARKVGKLGLKVGAAAGAISGVVTAITVGLSFPPSLIAMGITVAIGAAKGALIGGGLGFAMGGLFKGAKSALYLALTTPKQRLNRAARRGRNELDRMERQMMQDKAPENKKSRKVFEERLAYLRKHVPLWEYAAHNLKEVDCSPKARKAMKQSELVEFSPTSEKVSLESSSEEKKALPDLLVSTGGAKDDRPLLPGLTNDTSLL